MLRFLALASLALAIGACSPAPDDALVRSYLRLGRLEQAESLLAGRDDGAALHLRHELERQRTQRGELRRRLAEVRERLAVLERQTALDELAQLRERAPDPVAREWVAAALSQTTDWYAERRVMPAEPPAPAAGAPLRSERVKVPDPWGDAPPQTPRPGPARPQADRPRPHTQLAAQLDVAAQPEVAAENESASPAASSPTSQASLRSQAFEQALARLARAEGAQRDEALAEARSLSEETGSGAAWQAVLDERYEAALRKVSGSVLRRLEELAARRADLDRRRAFALDLIFDPVTYFYPFTVPEVSSARAAEYARAQAEVEARVAAVRERWEERSTVSVPSTFRAAAQELAWLSRIAGWRPRAPQAPPSWLLVLDPAADKVDIRTFAWDEGDRGRLRYNRAVQMHNQRQWSLTSEAADDERRQVELTGDYREMLGRRRLAWSSALQGASRCHADYLASGGAFGHLQPDPERQRPEDRMRRAGYPAPLVENCTSAVSTARAAHDKWLRSSEHHRNLLSSEAREMAAARAGQFWTQNYGADDAFADELDPWQD